MIKKSVLFADNQFGTDKWCIPTMGRTVMLLRYKKVLDWLYICFEEKKEKEKKHYDFCCNI